MMQDNGSTHWQSQNKNLVELTLEEEKINKDVVEHSEYVQDESHSSACLICFSPNSSNLILVSK